MSWNVVEEEVGSDWTTQGLVGHILVFMSKEKLLRSFKQSGDGTHDQICTQETVKVPRRIEQDELPGKTSPSER